MPWLLLCAVWLAGSLGLALAGRQLAPWLDWQPAAWATQPWRLWTAAFVHWSPLHLAMNLAAAALLAWLGWRARATPADALAWALAWPCTHLGLLLQPALRHYGGLSGLLHAGVAILALRLLVQAGAGRPRWVGALLLAGLATKLLLEAPWQLALRPLPEAGFAVAPLAHATGALAGLASALLCRAWPRRPSV
jgi:rhomboid family GlyGly-CTERM serine protease